MVLERVQVEEGFLNELDLRLVPGLNVLIGGRGTGKTSVIELIRFCLGARNYGARAETHSREHALAVLGSGEITVTLKRGSERVRVSRTANDPEPRSSGHFRAPLVFSQTEIESLGLEAPNRLRLIDSFLPPQSSSDPAEEEKFTAPIKSITEEIAHIAEETEAIRVKIRTLPELQENLAAVEAEEKEFAQSSEELGKKQRELQPLVKELSSLKAKGELYSRTHDELAGWRVSLRSVIEFPPELQTWPDEAGPADELRSIRSELQSVLQSLRKAEQQLARGIVSTEDLIADNRSRELELEEAARQLRRQIEEAQVGAGVLARRASELREQLSALQSLAALRRQRLEKLEALRARRSKLLDDLETVRATTFESREEVARKLTDDLSPRIRVRGTQSGSAVRAVGVLHHARVSGRA